MSPNSAVSGIRADWLFVACLPHAFDGSLCGPKFPSARYCKVIFR